MDPAVDLVGEKALGKAGVGRPVKLARNVICHDMPLVHQKNAVAERNGIDLVVGDHQHGDAESPLQAFQLVAQLHLDHGVQCRKGLVEQQQLAARDQRTGNGRPLLHAARKLGR